MLKKLQSLSARWSGLDSDLVSAYVCLQFVEEEKAVSTSLVLTLIGNDRPGLVEDLARVVSEHGGSWESSYNDS